MTDLRPDAEDLRLEAPDVAAGAAIATDLVVHIADKANHILLAQEL
jgi:hypothetical protein